MHFSLEAMQAFRRENDFSPTCRLTEAAYLGRRPRSTALFRCGCTGPRLWRKRRELWMRFLPLLKLYECERCGTRILARKVTKKRVQPVYLPGGTFTRLLNTAADAARSVDHARPGTGRRR